MVQKSIFRLALTGLSAKESDTEKWPEDRRTTAFRWHSTSPMHNILFWPGPLEKTVSWGVSASPESCAIFHLAASPPDGNRARTGFAALFRCDWLRPASRARAPRENPVRP